MIVEVVVCPGDRSDRDRGRHSLDEASERLPSIVLVLLPLDQQDQLSDPIEKVEVVHRKRKPQAE